MDVPVRAVARSSTTPPKATVGSPRLSVVVVNYVSWDDTDRLIGELRSSSAFGSEAEVVVVDNHSPPHPIVPRLRRAEGVSLRRWGTNRGFARAVNEGYRLSRGEWILLLNPDVSVPEGFLDAVLARADELAASEPRVGIVGFRLANGDGSVQLSTGRFPTLRSTLLGRLRPRATRKYSPPPEQGSGRVDWVTGCCLLIRRDCLEELSGLDAGFFLYYEDVDLCRRAALAGWSVRFDPTVTATHHRPLHLRPLPPHLHAITRHALLTYARKHWAAWQTTLLTWIVEIEARLRGGSSELIRIVRDLRNGNTALARKRILAVVRRYEEERDRAPVDRHPVPQPR